MCLRGNRKQARGTAKPLPSLCEIDDAPLVNLSTGIEITSGELWSDRGCLILAFRRPGCVLCRDEAVKIWRLKDKMNELGLAVVGLVHQCDMAEIVKFRKYWPGPLYWDSTKAFYTALGNGKLARETILPLLNPFSKAWRNIRQAKQSGNVLEHNSVGDGYLLGGTMVVGKGSSGVFLSHLESTYGDTASVQEVLSAAQQATCQRSHSDTKS